MYGKKCHFALYRVSVLLGLSDCCVVRYDYITENGTSDTEILVENGEGKNVGGSVHSARLTVHFVNDLVVCDGYRDLGHAREILVFESCIDRVLNKITNSFV